MWIISSGQIFIYCEPNTKNIITTVRLFLAMASADGSYEENLAKELKDRKWSIYSDLLGLSILLFITIFLHFRFHMENEIIKLFLMIGLFIYILVFFLRLRKKLLEYHSYMDDLHFEEGHVIKYSSSRRKEVLRISAEDVKAVYTNIKRMPWTIFVVYRTEKGLAAESFYKKRVRDKKKFYDFAKKNDLMHSDYIDIEELKETVEKD